jgi:hypothetical protein
VGSNARAGSIPASSTISGQFGRFFYAISSMNASGDWRLKKTNWTKLCCFEPKKRKVTANTALNTKRAVYDCPIGMLSIKYFYFAAITVTAVGFSIAVRL